MAIVVSIKRRKSIKCARVFPWPKSRYRPRVSQSRARCYIIIVDARIVLHKTFKSDDHGTIVNETNRFFFFFFFLRQTYIPRVSRGLIDWIAYSKITRSVSGRSGRVVVYRKTAQVIIKSESSGIIRTRLYADS